MTAIAGHIFDLNGRCVAPLADGVCPVRWIDIRHCDASYVGHTSIAHIGALNEREASEIVAAATAEAERCHAATHQRQVAPTEEGVEF